MNREPTQISIRKKRIRVALNDGFRDNILMKQKIYIRYLAQAPYSIDAIRMPNSCPASSSHIQTYCAKLRWT